MPFTIKNVLVWGRVGGSVGWLIIDSGHDLTVCKFEPCVKDLLDIKQEIGDKVVGWLDQPLLLSWLQPNFLRTTVLVQIEALREQKFGSRNNAKPTCPFDQY